MKILELIKFLDAASPIMLLLDSPLYLIIMLAIFSIPVVIAIAIIKKIRKNKNNK